MAIGSGLGASFGVAQESTYGTYVAPTKFFAGKSFGLNKVNNVQPLSGVAAGRPAAPDEVVTTTAATGKLEVDVLRNGFGLLLAHALGSSSTPVVQGATTAYLQTHALGDNRGKSLTLQKGLPDVGGTANPITALGAKVTSAEFSCGVDELLAASVEFDARAISEAQPLAAPSYPAGNMPFHFGEMSLKLGTFGTEAAVQGVRKVSVQIARGQDVARFYAGNAGLKSEPIWNEMIAVTGSIDIDLVTKSDFVDRFTGHTSTSLVWEFVGPTAIASTFFPTFRIRCPKVYFGGDIPEVSGPDMSKATVPFAAFYDATNGVVSAEYMSTDATL